jgi:hypothetical protein
MGVICTVCTDWGKGRLQRDEKHGPYGFEMQFDPSALGTLEPQNSVKVSQ